MRMVETWVALGWAALLLSSLLSMLAVFAGSQSGDLQGLLALQEFMLPFTLAAIAFYFWRARRLGDGRGGAALLWQHTPGWLVLVVASAASLTLIAELTFLLLIAHDVAPRPFAEHVPALIALTSALALAGAGANLRMMQTD